MTKEKDKQLQLLQIVTEALANLTTTQLQEDLGYSEGEFLRISSNKSDVEMALQCPEKFNAADASPVLLIGIVKMIANNGIQFDKDNAEHQRSMQQLFYFCQQYLLPRTELKMKNPQAQVLTIETIDVAFPSVEKLSGKSIREIIEEATAKNQPLKNPPPLPSLPKKEKHSADVPTAANIIPVTPAKEQLIHVLDETASCLLEGVKQQISILQSSRGSKTNQNKNAKSLAQLEVLQKTEKQIQEFQRQPEPLQGDEKMIKQQIEQRCLSLKRIIETTRDELKKIGYPNKLILFFNNFANFAAHIFNHTHAHRISKKNMEKALHLKEMRNKLIFNFDDQLHYSQPQHQPEKHSPSTHNKKNLD